LDARKRTDHWNDFERLVLANEEKYPKISKWLKQQVMPRLPSLERRAYLAYLGDQPIASAVLKRGMSSKFCHVKVAEDLQDLSIGDFFFSLMTLEVRGVAREIHFTLPEGLWHERKRFFTSFGFHEANEAGIQYRLFERELRCSASFDSVWRSVQGKLPRLLDRFTPSVLGGSASLVMSIQPRFIESVLSGIKTVEIRRRFSDRWVGRRVALYASRPNASLVGEAEIGEVVSGAPDWIWERLGRDVGCSKDEFDRYVRGAARVYAISLEDVKRYSPPVSRGELRDLFGADFVPPQSYAAVDRGWKRGVSLAGMLSGTVGEFDSGT
jgi:predicted transcriptional regulator